MPIYHKTIKSGNITEIYIYHSIRRSGEKSLPRMHNSNITPEEKQVINIRNARQKLTRLINTNFCKNKDMFVRLSYRKNITDEEAVKQFRKFMRRLKYHIKKNNLPELKYVAVTERGRGKPHHHIIMNYNDLNSIMKIWKEGGVYAVSLYSEDYTDLAAYITKETIRNEHGKRWSQSRNLEQPVINVRELKKEPSSAPRIPKGYILLEQQYFATNYGHRTWYVKAAKMNTDYFEGG